MDRWVRFGWLSAFPFHDGRDRVEDRYQLLAALVSVMVSIDRAVLTRRV
jgi:hypothetical protein